MVQFGQLLTYEREKKGLTLSDVSKYTKIREGFLKAIEFGEYEKLPSSAYAIGFVRNYIKFLGLPEQKTLALFRREFEAEKVDNVLPAGLADEGQFSSIRIKLTQSIALVSVAFLLLVGYLLFQYRYAVINPPLTITSPSEMQVFQAAVLVTGKTDPNAMVYVNNEAIAVDENGSFRKTINAFSGKDTITIKVINRFGKQTSIIRHVEVK